MALKEELRDQGNWLFRHRSYLPIFLLPLVLIGMMTVRINFVSPNHEILFKWACVIISLLGFAVRIITIGQVPKKTSGRNTKKQIAEIVNTSGIYSVVRHPLYLGNFLMWLGIILFVKSIWVAVLFILLYWIYYERIMYAEEAFLNDKFGEDYIKWASRTPPFFPNWKLWQKSQLYFSIRNVLKREYSGFFGLVVSFVAIINLDLIITAKKFIYDRNSLIILVISFAIYLILRSIKKFTRLLNEKGR